jgi:hypothetical protein
MSNRIEETNIPAGTRIRTGAPAERPQAALDGLIKLFSQKQNVISARLGLMEMLYPDGKSEFTYTVGIQCSSDEQATIQQAVEVLQSAPAGRWPISIFPPTNQYFTKDAIVFFGGATDAQPKDSELMKTDLEKLKEKIRNAPKQVFLSFYLCVILGVLLALRGILLRAALGTFFGNGLLFSAMIAAFFILNGLFLLSKERSAYLLIVILALLPAFGSLVGSVHLLALLVKGEIAVNWLDTFASVVAMLQSLVIVALYFMLLSRTTRSYVWSRSQSAPL